MSNGSTGLSVSRVHLLQRGFRKEKSAKIVKAPLEKETSGRKCDKLLHAHDDAPCVVKVDAVRNA